MNCKNCGGEISAERAALGYDYCTGTRCVEACLKGLDMVAVHVNKASDQYVLRRQLDIPNDTSTRSIDPVWAAVPAPMVEQETPSRKRERPKTTEEKIDELEAELDAALAAESDPSKRNKLVNDYNAKLRRFDIRYRRIRQRRKA